MLIMITLMIIIFTLIWLVTAIPQWRQQKRQAPRTEAILTAEGVHFDARENRSFTAWAEYRFYYENRWGFFLWGKSSHHWIMIPKRVFGSQEDMQQCREWFQARLNYSCWFRY